VSVIRGGQVYLKADLKKVRKRLFEKGFCMKNGFPIPNFAYLSETQYGSLIKVSYILRGLASYYKLARNYRDFMSRINYILRYSSAKLFAAKFRLPSIAKVFAKAGKDLTRPINNPKPNKALIAQTEEKISDYLKSIGIPEDRFKDNPLIRLGLPYTKFGDIPKPDLAPLKKKTSTLHSTRRLKPHPMVDTSPPGTH